MNKSQAKDLILSMKSKLKAKGIILFDNFGNMSSIRREAQNHKYCRGIRGYAIIHSDLCIKCVQCSKNTDWDVGINYSIYSDTAQIAEDAGLIFNRSESLWYIKPIGVKDDYVVK